MMLDCPFCSVRKKKKNSKQHHSQINFNFPFFSIIEFVVVSYTVKTWTYKFPSTKILHGSHCIAIIRLYIISNVLCDLWLACPFSWENNSHCTIIQMSAAQKSNISNRHQKMLKPASNNISNLYQMTKSPKIGSVFKILNNIPDSMS